MLRKTVDGISLVLTPSGSPRVARLLKLKNTVHYEAISVGNIARVEYCPRSSLQAKILMQHVVLKYRFVAKS